MYGLKSTVVRLRVTPEEKAEWTAAAKAFGAERAARRGFHYRSDDRSLSEFIRGAVEAWIKARAAKPDEQKKPKRRPVKA